MKKNKNILVKVIATILVGGMVLTGCTAEKADTLQEVRLNEVVHSIFYAPQYVAL